MILVVLQFLGAGIYQVVHVEGLSVDMRADVGRGSGLVGVPNLAVPELVCLLLNEAGA